ncbi:DUF3718 domain-containing protein [Shewanella mesophila]|uniref:DUF3718 domain-containing protein n=1 Tax=Shewanella mesophila TaxID=2864208 RepID=UPI001C65E9BB|nr:DUF3718 domain-containing protein [Shewanella mesophila]QYJ87794.1 DUF3718 domain-containing protein [Shewanella mesophila]
MKTLLAFTAGTLLMLSPSLAAVTYQFVAVDKSVETQICVAAGNDERALLRSKIGNYSHNVRLSTNLINCNGMSITQFSYKYGALQSYDYLNRFTALKNRVQHKPSVTIKELSLRDTGGLADVVTIRVSAK